MYIIYGIVYNFTDKILKLFPIKSLPTINNVKYGSQEHINAPENKILLIK